MIMLIIICCVLSPKFAVFISSNAAEPISPIITGRNPAKTALTAMLSLCLEKGEWHSEIR